MVRCHFIMNTIKWVAVRGGLIIVYIQAVGMFGVGEPLSDSFCDQI